MAGPRIRRAADQREMERTRDDLITTGYHVTSSGENTTLLSNAGWGTPGMHILVFLLTAWWTFLIGNVIYAVYAHTKGDEVLIKVDEPLHLTGTATITTTEA